MTKTSRHIKERRKLLQHSRTKSLAEAAVSATTNAKYRQAVADFFRYLRYLTGRPASESLTQPMEADIALCEYIQHLWETEQSKGVASYTCSGLPHLIPPLTNQLTGAKRLMQAWGRKEIPLRATPINLAQLQAVAGAAVAQGKHKLALSILLSFHVLLRPIEMVSVR